MNRISIIAAAAAAALTLAACGSDSADFAREFNAAQQPLEQLLTEASGSSDASQFTKLADGLDDTAAKLRALDPPDDARDELDAFVAEVTSSADAMRDAGKAVEEKQPDAMLAALGDLQERMTAIGSAQQKLQAAINN